MTYCGLDIVICCSSEECFGVSSFVGVKMILRGGGQVEAEEEEEEDEE